MLTKLAMTGFKSRWKDYLVLFSGLVMSSAIFYMFEAIATNQSFLHGNASMSMISFVFQFGAVLLTIITLVYISYANSFLLSMRKRDYGLFMILGARKNKIGQLIWAETLVVGLCSAVVGVLVGIALTAGIGQLLTQALEISLKHFIPFYLPAVLWTLGLYVGLFLLAGFFNRLSLTRTPALKLLHSEENPNRPKAKPFSQTIQVISGLILLGIGYWSMANVVKIGQLTIPLALVTIVLGTYLLFNAIFVWLVLLLKRTKMANHGLNNFTLAQLSFRIRNYTKILSIVAILFAMALGAITVGMGFHRQIPLLAESSGAYDLGIVNPTNKEKDLINQLTLSSKTTYQTKLGAKQTYYRTSQFNHQPFTVAKQNTKQMFSHHNVSLNAKQLEQQKYTYEVQRYLPLTEQQKAATFLTDQQFQQVKSPTKTLVVFRTKDLMQAKPILKKIANLEAKRQPQSSIELMSYGRYYGLVMANTMFSGLEFMGFFLGIAFLAMLASCLMFKILSGAMADVHRYQMLTKIGTRQSVLRQSIAKEIGVLFLLPGIVGVVHVLFGLQLFKTLMDNPYTGLWIPFGIFAVLYLLYYGLTVGIYRRIVLAK